MPPAGDRRRRYRLPGPGPRVQPDVRSSCLSCARAPPKTDKLLPLAVTVRSRPEAATAPSLCGTRSRRSACDSCPSTPLPCRRSRSTAMGRSLQWRTARRTKEGWARPARRRRHRAAGTGLLFGCAAMRSDRRPRREGLVRLGLCMTCHVVPLYPQDRKNIACRVVRCSLFAPLPRSSHEADKWRKARQLAAGVAASLPLARLPGSPSSPALDVPDGI